MPLNKPNQLMTGVWQETVTHAASVNLRLSASV